MPKLDWACLCDLAYFDGAQQLCMIGVDPRGSVRTLPVGIYRFVIVARVLDAGAEDGVRVVVSLSTPAGGQAIDPRAAFRTDRRGDYVLVSLNSLPFLDEGTYRFEVTLGSLPAFDISLVISNADRIGWMESRAS